MPSSRATARSDSAGGAVGGEVPAGGLDDLAGELGADAGAGSGGGHAGQSDTDREQLATNASRCSAHARTGAQVRGGYRSHCDREQSTPFWGPDFDALQQQDPEIAGVVLDELDRLRGGLQLIASENLTSPAVLAALGSTLSNKYAEGYPGRRYYGGCEVVDLAEEIGNARTKELFGAEHANLQPHSGASANFAVYAAFTQPGDTVLAMDLKQGGHLTHGSKVSFSGKWFHAVSYTVRQDTELIDYDQVRDLAREHRPKIDHRRRHGVPAADRLRGVPGDRRRGRRHAHGRRGALHRPGRRQGDPVAGAATPTSSRPPRTRCCAARAAA